MSNASSSSHSDHNSKIDRANTAGITAAKTAANTAAYTTANTTALDPCNLDHANLQDIQTLRSHVREQGRLLDKLNSRNDNLEKSLIGTSSKMNRLLDVLVEERKERESEVSKLTRRVEVLNDRVQLMRVAFRACKKKLIDAAANAIVDKHRSEIY